MRHSKIRDPQVSAGSMADIAFLLLIFFLVTAVITNDEGFNRKLPKPCLEPLCTTELNERNVLRIAINSNNQIMINDEIASLSKIKETTKSFLDNNGDKSCNYCNGKQLQNLSDNPTIAVISLQTHPQSTYEFFIKVQDELTKAYYELRMKYAVSVLGKTENTLNKKDMEFLREAYPFVISEAETN